MGINMTARERSTQPFRGIQVEAVEVQCIGQGQWEAKLRISGQLPVPCGNHHANKGDAVEAALKRARELNAQLQDVFEQWVSHTRAELSSGPVTF